MKLFELIKENRFQLTEIDMNKKTNILDILRYEKEGNKVPSSLNEIVTPGGEEYEINKNEERYAYTYFIRHLLPIMIEDTYLKFIRKHPTMYSERRYPRISAQDISRTVMKKRRDRDSISYESIINDYVGFNFFLKKMVLKLPDGTKKPAMSIGCQGPINKDWKWYSIKGL